MKFWIGVLLSIIGTALIITAFIYQCRLSVLMYGAVFERVIIPHWSLWLYSGAIPVMIGSAMMNN